MNNRNTPKTGNIQLKAQNNLDNLIPDIQLNIFFHLAPEELAMLMLASTALFKAGYEANAYWKSVSFRHFPNDFSQVKNARNWFDISKQFHTKNYGSFSKNHGMYFGMQIFAADKKNYAKLFSLVKEGNLAGIQVCTIEIADLFMKDNNSKTLLDWALELGHQHILDHFFEFVSKPYLTVNNEFNTKKAISSVSPKGQGDTILHWAILCNQTHLITELVKDIQHLRILSDKGLPASHLACHPYRFDILKLILQTHPDLINQVDCHGNTILLRASFEGYCKIVDFLLKQGAAVSRVASSGFSPLKKVNIHGSSSGMNAMHLAAYSGHVEVVQLLLKKNPRLLNIGSDYNHTALIWAVINRQSEVVRYLAEQGADLDININRYYDYAGYTALCFAAANNDLESSKILIEFGASPFFVEERYSVSPRSLAKFMSPTLGLIKLEEFIRDFHPEENYNVSIFNLFSRSPKKEIDNSLLIDAAVTLKAVVLGHKDRSALDKYKNELETEDLGVIYYLLTDCLPAKQQQVAPQPK